jgi:choline dehydrogenase-like flavoprotein
MAVMTKDADIIIVGSGPAGVSAAWPLVRAGLGVLMIDASPGRCDPESADADDWQARFGRDFSGLDLTENISPKFATLLAKKMLDGFAPRNGLECQNFFAAGSLAQGGLSKIWGALVEPFDADELSGFPFEAEGLAASYQAVSDRIGTLSADCPEKLASPAARRLFERSLQEPASDGFTLKPATNAVTDKAMDGREPCSRCGACLFGCPRHSIYDSAYELPALRRFPNFHYLGDHFVRAIASDGPDHVLDIETKGARRSIRAPALVMAAGTLATTPLILRRLNWIDRPVRLLTNPVAATAFVIPNLIGSERPRDSFSLGQLFYRLRTPSTSAAGVVYGADALPLDLFAARLPLSRPAALQLAHALAPALLIANCYLVGHFSQNVMRVHAQEAEHKMTIEGMSSSETQRTLRGAVSALKKQMRKLGALSVPGTTSLLPPGGDAHYASTLPMGGAGPLATSNIGELKDVPNIFIVDGSVLPHLPATHPTLTIMANADRIGAEIARRIAADKSAAPRALRLTA